MKVKRPAFGAEGYVLDHQTATAVQKFIDIRRRKRSCRLRRQSALRHLLRQPGKLRRRLDRRISSTNSRNAAATIFARCSPRSSTDIGPKTLDIRHDWGKTLTELFNDYFVKQMRSFAQTTRHALPHPSLRPPSAAESTATSMPISPKAKAINGTTTAPPDTPAPHVICSASPSVHLRRSPGFTTQPFRATPLDIKAEADLHFLQGVNQIICHGWPYTPAGVAFPGWSFYAAGVFDDQNPWNIVMPDVTRYLQRVSFMLRQGPPANDIALYLLQRDAWARFSPGDGSQFTTALPMKSANVLATKSSATILDAGYNLDFFDDGMLDARGRVDNGTLFFGQPVAGRGGRSQGVRYRIVVLAGVERMPLSTLKKLEDFADRGG